MYELPYIIMEPEIHTAKSVIGKLETQGILCSESQSNSSSYLSLKTGRQLSCLKMLTYSAVLSYSGLHLIGWILPTLGRAACVPQSRDSDINLIQEHPPRHPRIMFNQVSEHSVAQSIWHTKWTIIIFHQEKDVMRKRNIWYPVYEKS